MQLVAFEKKKFLEFREEDAKSVKDFEQKKSALAELIRLAERDVASAKKRHLVAKNAAGVKSAVAIGKQRVEAKPN